MIATSRTTMIGTTSANSTTLWPRATLGRRSHRVSTPAEASKARFATLLERPGVLAAARVFNAWSRFPAGGLRESHADLASHLSSSTFGGRATLFGDTPHRACGTQVG